MGNSQQSDYDKYLATMHAQFLTPNEILREVVRKGTGQDFTTKLKIIAGEVSEVYDITLQDTTHVILRISRSSYPNFQQEKWAIEQVKKIGVPVPEILLVTYLTVDQEELSFCLMNKVEGEPLERGKIDFSVLTQAERKFYTIKAGEILSKIHSIQTHGIGWIIGEGKAEYETADALFGDVDKKQKHWYEIAELEKVTKQEMDSAFAIIHDLRKDYMTVTPRLNHGDFGHKHVMVKDKRITAILDWGGVRSDTPIYDFASWDYWFGNYIPTAWLKEGYQDKTLFGGDFEPILHRLRVLKGLEIIDWYESQKFQQAVAMAIEKLRKDIDYFH
jgi:aminoglycoside phosphotransferase (APT) family kinase protein